MCKKKLITSFIGGGGGNACEYRSVTIIIAQHLAKSCRFISQVIFYSIGYVRNIIFLHVVEQWKPPCSYLKLTGRSVEIARLWLNLYQQVAIPADVNHFRLFSSSLCNNQGSLSLPQKKTAPRSPALQSLRPPQLWSPIPFFPTKCWEQILITLCCWPMPTPLPIRK